MSAVQNIDNKSFIKSSGEGEVLGRVAGAGIVPMVGGSDGVVVLEEAACSVADVLAERGKLSEGEVRAVGVEAANALARVHEAGLIHCDVKAANLLLSHDGQLWLADFDAAAPANGMPLVRGTHALAELAPRAEVAADILGLAVTLVQLATGLEIDLRVAWTSADLNRIGCPPMLSSDIAMALGSQETGEFTMTWFATLLGRYRDPLRLPKPVVPSINDDLPETIDYPALKSAG